MHYPCPAYQSGADVFLHSLLLLAFAGGRPSANAVAAELQNAALGVLEKGMLPVHRKAVANAKRLAHTKVR